jgi:hypothetical protein
MAGIFALSTTSFLYKFTTNKMIAYLTTIVNFNKIQILTQFLPAITMQTEH